MFNFSNNAGQNGQAGQANQTFQFGSKPAQDQNASAPSTFNFGSGNSNDTAASKPAFSFSGNNSNAAPFGAASSNTESKPSLFGSSTAAPAAQPSQSQPSLFGGASTPAKSDAKPGFFFGNSNNTSNSTSLFGGQKTDAKPAGFNLGASQTSDAKPQTSGGLFGGAQSQPAASSTAPAAGGFSFGAKTDKPAESKPLFGSTSATSGSKPLFGGSDATAAPAADKPAEKPVLSFGASSAQPAASKPAFAFGATSGNKTDAPAPASSSAVSTTSSLSFGQKKDDSKPAFSFGEKKDEPKPAAAPSFSLGGSKPDASKPASGFSFGGSSITASTGAANGTKAEAKPATTGFSFGTKPDDKAAATPAAPSSFSFSGAKTETKPAATGFNLNVSKDSEKKEDAKPAEKKEEPKAGGFASGTIDKPQVKLEDIKPQPMSIKNKTLEDLITKWTNQLSSSTKIFENYSDKINHWDQVLVTSSEKISKLYADSLTCDQKQSKVDQTLSYIEKQQEELDKLLDGYEKQSESLLASVQQVNTTNGNERVFTNDQIRENSYRLAESLENKLDSLGTNFSSLISEVNEVSDSFNRSLLSTSSKSLEEKTSLEDILKLLNNHLESLNWIEKNEGMLKEQIETLKNSTV
ncbi:hypothetical protein OGAPHI_004264 [Ogataea philodendri]|uniref:Nucleoporin NSP1 n=1 Tax=Ogataea philodendri TaxID=1378263 RepID=A0A9P8P6D9_9ASCO|nr:uncharacterized protein OGAPHI_004264 [Ogataea philodendri]KAH3666075.1 hypothetical protein OGAPHI_004264 [Ogataea philodendri]